MTLLSYFALALVAVNGITSALPQDTGNGTSNASTDPSSSSLVTDASSGYSSDQSHSNAAPDDGSSDQSLNNAAPDDGSSDQPLNNAAPSDGSGDAGDDADLAAAPSDGSDDSGLNAAPSSGGAQVTNGHGFDTGAGNSNNGNVDDGNGNGAIDAYTCYSGGWQNYPDSSKWISFQDMWNSNVGAMMQGCSALGLSPDDTQDQVSNPPHRFCST
jgi:hypothetical protein